MFGSPTSQLGSPSPPPSTVFLALGDPVQQNAVWHDPVVPAIEAPGRPGRGLGDGDARVQAVQAPSPPNAIAPIPLETGFVEYVWNVPTSGSSPRGHERVEADQRHDRLVDVRYVIATVTQRAPDREYRMGRACQVGDRAVGGDPDRAAQRHEVLGWLTPLRARPAVQAPRERVVGIERREDVGLVSLCSQLSRQRLDVARDAARVGPGVRRNQSNPHSCTVSGAEEATQLSSHSMSKETRTLVHRRTHKCPKRGVQTRLPPVRTICSPCATVRLRS